MGNTEQKSQLSQYESAKLRFEGRMEKERIKEQVAQRQLGPHWLHEDSNWWLESLLEDVRKRRATSKSGGIRGTSGDSLRAATDNEYHG